MRVGAGNLPLLDEVGLGGFGVEKTPGGIRCCLRRCLRWVAVDSGLHKVATDGAAGGSLLEGAIAAFLVIVAPSGRHKLGGVDRRSMDRIPCAEREVVVDAGVVGGGSLGCVREAEGCRVAFGVSEIGGRRSEGSQGGQVGHGEYGE